MKLQSVDKLFASWFFNNQKSTLQLQELHFYGTVANPIPPCDLTPHLPHSVSLTLFAITSMVQQ